jgi:RecA/RadA recombinase
MKAINFYGGPGSGKSTLATELFVYMKKKGSNIEQRYAHVELYK